MLFETPQEELTDEEVAAVLRQTFGRWASAGRLPRHADVWLAGIHDGIRRPVPAMLLAAAVAEFEAWMQGELLAVLPRASPIAVAAGSSPLPRD